MVFAEVPIGFLRIEYAERVFAEAKVALAPMPRSALFRTGKAFREYRSRGGTRTGVLPDFFVGAHAAAAGRACSPATVAVTAATFPMSLSSSRPKPLPPAAPAG